MADEAQFSRRDCLRTTVAAGALAVSQMPLSALAFPAAEETDELIPFLDPQSINPERPMLNWSELTSWQTPTSDLFSVGHYGEPEPVDAADWRLDVSGLVDSPKSLSLADLKSRPKREYMATLECSGNGASSRFMGAIGNVRMGGTPLAPILKECGLRPEAIEIVFFGADSGEEEIRDKKYKQNFARSLSRDDALGEDVILAYEMNGEPLEQKHGAPVRLVVPGWYAVAWVKWLDRIEVHDRRFMGRFMGRDYVTIRGEKRGDETIWRETSVGPIRIKSIVARVVRRANGSLRVSGAAWNDGTSLGAVELKIDGGPWTPVTMDVRSDEKYAWTFWSYDWKNPEPGEHSLVSRCVDVNGRAQPAQSDESIRLKRTYWEANQQVRRRIKV